MSKYLDVTAWPNEELMALHDAGVLLFGYDGKEIDIPIRSTSVPLWSNNASDYDARRRGHLCELYIQVEE